MSTEIFNEDQPYSVKSFQIDYSALGKKITMVLNGDRDTLDDLASSFMQDGGAMNSFPGIPDTVAALIDETIAVRTPKLDYKGEGKLADLILIGEAGLLEGDSPIADSGIDADGVPANVTGRVIYEPDDVALEYGLPFRAGLKWDLTVSANSVLAMDSDFEDVASLLDDLNLDHETISWLAIINLYQNGSITEAQRGTLFSYLNAEDATGAQDWMKRYLRGQTSYRFWIPNVSITKRYRTLPLTADSVPIPGSISSVGDDDGPPDWTGAPDEDNYGNSYLYWRGATQVEFVGEFWVVEEQWNGFLDFDEDLYNDPTADDGDDT